MTRWTLATRPVFPSGNAWGIPDLLHTPPQELPRSTALAESEAGPGALVNYRTIPPRAGSTLAFYVDDYRFEHAWTRPAAFAKQLRRWQLNAVIEPDFSMYGDHPLAVALFNLYRSRWLGRFWQREGLSVIPSLCWNEQTVEHVACGIPAGSVVACEMRPRFKDPFVFRDGLQRAVSEISPAAVILYGVTDWELPPGPDYVRLPAWSPRRRLGSQAGPANQHPGLRG